jgi:predicted RecB family nuclease
MAPGMVMEVLKQIIQQRSDPAQCYHYIDDEKTMRLEKVLNIPNSFETKKSQITEKEK